jgi:hypothetical protein
MVISDHIIPQQWSRTGGGLWGLCSSDSLNYSRDGFYSHLAATAEAASAVYHHLEPPWVGSRFTLHPNQHQHRLWCLRFVSVPRVHSHFSCGDFAIPFVAICFSEVPRWRFCNLIVAISCRIRTPRLIPQRTSIRNQNRHCQAERFVFGPHPQQPAHRTHPTRPSICLV